MDPKIVRKIDYFIGVPSCFLVTVYDKIKNLLYAQKKEVFPKKILITEISEMGSIILSYPMIKRIREYYPDSEIFFLTFKKCSPAIELLEIIDKENILTLDDSSLKNFFSDVIRVLVRLRKEKIDTAADLELFARFSNLISYLSGAKTRVGFNNFNAEGLYRGDLLTHNIQYNPYKHISINFLAFAEALKENKKNYPLVKKEIHNKTEIPYIRITENQKKEIFNQLKNANPKITEKSKIVVFSYEAGDLPIRAWPIKNFIEIGKKLLNHNDVFVVLIGTKKIKDTSKFIEKQINNKRCINLTGATEFNELINLFSISDLLISIDSGPPHFASLTRTKTIVLFGPETPLLYSPLNKNAVTIYKNLHCSPCLNAFNHRTTPCKDNKCLKNINPTEVYKKAMELLNGKTEKHQKK